MGKPTLNRTLVKGKQLRDGITKGIDKLYEVALTAYGINGGNVMLERRASAPTISHDGVSNLEELEVEDAVEDMAIKVVKQASQRTNETAGDGTTLSAILSSHLYKWALKKIETEGEKPTTVAKEIEANIPKILAAIDEVTTKELSPELLKGACIISAGDEGLGELIYDVVSQVGEYGGINVSYVGSLGVSTKVVNGMYIPSGYLDPKLINDLDGNRTVLEDVPVVILSSTITRQDEILPILEHLRTHTFQKAVFFADITGDALRVLELNRNFDACVVKPQSSNYEVLLKDVALYTGGQVYSGAPADWKLEYAGCAESVTITQRETTLLGGRGKKENIDKVVEDLKDKLAKAEPQDRPFLEGRVARLTANVATIYVGGASAVERGEVKLRVDDAVCAAKTALAGGVVPGGGVCLRDIAQKLNLGYLACPYGDLLENSDISGEKCAEGCGYNLKTKQVCNMVENYLVDPAIVVREAVINSHSVVAKLITTQMALVFEDRKWDF